MRNYFIIFGFFTAAFLLGCSTTPDSATADGSAPGGSIAGSRSAPDIVGMRSINGADNLVFTYKVRDNLDVRVIFENETAYDAVQLGLSLLNKCNEDKYVPAVEEEAFFPEFFAMVNIDTRDGLLYISEKEAVAFASFMYSEYQKKVLPPDQVESLSERPVVDQFIVPGSEPEKKRGTL